MTTAIEDVAKALSDSMNEFKLGIKTISDRFEKAEGRFTAADVRFLALENSIKEQLVKQHGENNIPKKTWGWARYCYAKKTGEWQYAQFEKEEVAKYQDYLQKTGSTNFTGGGALIPPQYVNELITLLRGQLVLERLGVRTITGLTASPIIFPRQTGGLTGYWISEGTAPTASDTTWGRLELQPKKAGALVKLTNDIILLSNPDIEAATRADIVRALQELIDIAAFAGTGTLGQPLGIDNWVPAVNAATYTTTNIGTKWASIMDMIKLVEDDNALTGSLAFVMPPAVWWLWLKLVTGVSGAELPVFPSYFNSVPFSDPKPGPQALMGYPVFRSSSVPTGVVYFGDWSQFILAIWSQMEVTSSGETSTAFQNDELWIRAIIRLDLALRRDVSFCRMPSVTS